MTKLEYSDLYKFLASLGFVLIGLSLLVPWLFLRESFDALLNTTTVLPLKCHSERPKGAKNLVLGWQFAPVKRDCFVASPSLCSGLRLTPRNDKCGCWHSIVGCASGFAFGPLLKRV